MSCLLSSLSGPEWRSLVLALLIGLDLWGGTNMAVAAAARVLSPQERLDDLQAAEKANALPRATDDSQASRALLQGTIRTADGEPLPAGTSLTAESRSDRSSATTALGQVGPTFSVRVPAGAVWLRVNAAGYPPTRVGPYQANSGELTDGIEIVLSKGQEVGWRIVDEAGQPVPGAVLHGGLFLQGTSDSVSDYTADAQGVIRIAYAGGAGTFTFDARTPGYQMDRREGVRPLPGVLGPWVLRRAAVTAGRLLGPDRQPLVGTTLRLYAELAGDQALSCAGTSGPLLATTRADGRFSLDMLRDGIDCVLLAETPAKGRFLLRGVRAGQADITVDTGPELTVTGRLVGDLSVLPREGDVPQLPYELCVTIGHSGHAWTERTPVTPAPGGGTFCLRNLLPGTVTLQAGGRSLAVKVAEPVRDVVLDLTAAPSARREVLFELVPEPGQPLPAGPLEVYAATADGSAPAVYEPRTPTGKAVSVQAYVGGPVSLHGRRLVGGWFPDVIMAKVPAGDGPLRLRVRVVPAGAISGRVLEPDGTPARQGVSLSVCVARKSPRVEPTRALDAQTEVNPVGGTFMVTPLPLGGEYVIKALRGRTFVLSQPVRVDEKTPRPEVELRLVAGVPATVEVVAPDGRPAAGVPVDVSYDSPYGGHGFSPSPVTDADGRHVLAGINPDAPGAYWVTLPVRRDYQPERLKLRLDGQPTVVRLRRGQVVTGRVVEAKSGRPVPGVELYALPADVRAGQWVPRFDAEAASDREGRFRFSNLPDAECALNVGSEANLADPTPRLTVTPGQATPLEVRVVLPAWSTLQPVPPAPSP